MRGLGVCLDRAWLFLGSARLFFWLASLVLIACALGGLIPQGTDLSGLAADWGRIPVGLLKAFGLNAVFSQWWFISLLVLLGANLAACSIQSVPVARPGVWATHAGMLVILIGGVITGIWAERGSLRLEEGKTSRHVASSRGDLHLPFEVLLKEFRIEYHRGPGHELTVVEEGARQTVWLEPGAIEPTSLGPDLSLRLLKAFPSFSMSQEGPVNRGRGAANPAVQVEIIIGGEDKAVTWLFERFPLFYREHGPRTDLPEIYYRHTAARVKQFVSELEVREGDETVKRATISVNTPLAWKGYKLYQASYDPDRDDVSILQVSRDPGIPAVYAGFIILPLGLLWSLLGRSRT